MALIEGLAVAADWPGQRDLPIHGRVRFADRRQRRELLLHGAALARTGHQAAVAGRVGTDRGIDVEAVDRGIGVGGDGVARELALGVDGHALDGSGTQVRTARQA